MNILNTINNLSFKKLAAASLVIALALAVPISVFVMQQQTKTKTTAFFEKPEPIIPGKEYGQPSSGDPVITLVWPFLGKIGDAVIIEGKNLGNNPINKSLKIGNIMVSENDIIKWTPELIEFNIPLQSISGNISLSVVDKTTSWPYHFTVYSLDTKTQVTENNHLVKVLKGPPAGKIEIYLANGTKIESDKFDGVEFPADQKIISVSVLNNNNISTSFFVNPDEFGF